MSVLSPTPIGGSLVSVWAGRSEQYRPEIDGLRAVSILAVVLYHARVPGFGAGYFGVDIFFVISGFLITGQLLREAKSTGTIHLAMFYARRVRRLIPAFVAMAIGTTALALVYLHPMTEQRLFGNALTRSAFFYYNIAVWRGGYAYDAEPADQQVLMHTWSLGVEEQFYLVWPLLCLAVLRSGRPLAGFSIVALASLTASWWFLPRDADAVFFLLPFRAWELALGACVAAGRWKAASPIAGGGALVGACLVVLTLASGTPRQGGLLPQLLVALGVMLIAAFGAMPNLASSLLRTAPMVLLGRMSYAWYLWHWPILVIGRLTAIDEQPQVQFMALAAGLVLAALSYVWVEAPSRQLPIPRPLRTLAWGAVAVTFAALVGASLELRGRRLMLQPENALHLERLARAPVRPCETEIASLGCDLSAIPSVIGPSLLLWGDSFAQALSPALSDYSRDSGLSIRLLVRYSCPPLLGAVPAGSADPSTPDPVCEASLEATKRQIQRDPARITGVILAGAWLGPVAGDALAKPHKMFDRQGQELVSSDAALSRGMDATLDFLSSNGIRVLIVGTPPEFPFDVPRCLWWSPPRCSVDRAWRSTARAQVRAGIDAAIRDRGDVRYVDLFERLCPGTRCSGGTLDEPLLADRGHLTALAARRLVRPILTPYLDWLGGIAPIDSSAKPFTASEIGWRMDPVSDRLGGDRIAGSRIRRSIDSWRRDEHPANVGDPSFGDLRLRTAMEHGKLASLMPSTAPLPEGNS